MIRFARTTDFEQIEFGAFNHGQHLPRMRRWELPFALFQAQLSSTMSVFDCTINPANLQERLSLLYPFVLYRHFNPLQNAQFSVPFGQPDEAFDRVLCINTLEHLLRPQREKLIAALARKLRPGGRLILTSDAYFDSAWENPTFIDAGVLRADRQEVLGGFNKVTPAEWLELCGRHGLEPLTDEVEEALEGDPQLYLNAPPFPHACIGGVFVKPPRAAQVRRKVMLALLTWNKRDVSLESVQAYIEEARMLRRLGHEPILCVCDNGSTDGTAEALRAMDGTIDVPHHFILNRENLGNCIARNQIIDAMLECDADYILFIDGDIEVVPFSSFAMMRYLEDSGRQVGSLGAFSFQTATIRQDASPFHFSVRSGPIVESLDVTSSGYGMYRRAVFEAGIRFEEAEPFRGAGWGFEDNDLAFQMDVKGFLKTHFHGMTFLHRDVQSSVKNMLEQGIDATAACARRQQYLLEKWSSVPHLAQGPLVTLRAMVFQF